ncbi:conserved hypothetical protein [Culex quinquefasciatus]|uniref:G-protein coupled receptors family 1 profile domain-containing protein n=1 Tax=Culex quinquefasciatus TaxID=7176 RepID=B0XAE8_CULQU|nr:conserved hypothetical protein [Culex quinquefasciatus]|eukprot:XP_001866620.1 conserved hypothetical protein [Culex quinquefasciatus]
MKIRTTNKVFKSHVIISLCWLAGSIIGFLPLFGWHEKPQIDTCLFTKVMDYDYLVFLYFATIITPALIMLGFYAHIYRVIVKQHESYIYLTRFTELDKYEEC